MNIERLLNSIKYRLRLIVGRAVITACGGKTVDLDLLEGESREDVDFMQQFGFSSKPKGKVSAVSLFVGGSRDNGVVVASRGEDSDMDFNLEDGEVAIHTPYGSSIHLKKDGDIEITTKNGVGTLNVKGNINIEKGGLTADLDVKSNVMVKPVSLTLHTHPTAVGPSGPPM